MNLNYNMQPETSFHCVENCRKHASIVWKTLPQAHPWKMRLSAAFWGLRGGIRRDWVCPFSAPFSVPLQKRMVWREVPWLTEILSVKEEEVGWGYW